MNRQKKLAKQNTPLYKRVPTLNLVDYSDIKVPLVVIYDSPKDFPGKVVARVWDGEKSRPTNVYCEYENLKRCEDDVCQPDSCSNFQGHRRMMRALLKHT